MHLDVNFYQLNLTRGRSYVQLPDYIANRKAVINTQNDDSECLYVQLSQRIDGQILALIQRGSRILENS